MEKKTYFTPSYISQQVSNDKLNLVEFDQKFSIQSEDIVFHNYLSNILTKLILNGVKTYNDLVKESEKCKNKTSSLTKSLRVHVQSMNEFYNNRFTECKKKYEELSEVDKQEAEKFGFFYSI